MPRSSTNYGGALMKKGGGLRARMAPATHQGSVGMGTCGGGVSRSGGMKYAGGAETMKGALTAAKNPWIFFLKEYSEKHGVKYDPANEDARKAYKKAKSRVLKTL